jgi:hypothetical protein
MPLTSVLIMTRLERKGLELSDMSSVQRVKGAHELLQESKVSKLFSLLIDDDNKHR